MYVNGKKFCSRCRLYLKPEEFDFDSYRRPICSHCFTEENVVSGDYLPISEYKVGYGCLCEGGLANVTNAIQRNYSGSVFTIKAMGMLPIRTTPEHPFLTAKLGIRRLRFYWRKASEIRPATKTNFGDYLVIPRVLGYETIMTLNLESFLNEHGKKVALGKNIPLRFPLNVDTAWLIGLYVAEGNSSSIGLNFTLNKREVFIAERIRSIAKVLGYSACFTQAPTALCVCIPSRILARAFVSWCGTNALTKRIPHFILYHRSLQLLQSALNGYWDGDGCIVNYNIYTANTISKILALQLQLAIGRLGFAAKLQTSGYDGHKAVIQNREVTTHKVFVVSYSPLRRFSQVLVADRHILYPVKTISTEQFNGTVYNLETTKGTYLINNVLVHNCSLLLRHRPRRRADREEPIRL